MEERIDKLERMLKELYRIEMENNDYLKKVDRRQRYGIYWRVFLFVIALGSALGIYYLAQPYIEQFLSFYNQFETSITQLNTLPEQVRGIFKP